MLRTLDVGISPWHGQAGSTFPFSVVEDSGLSGHFGGTFFANPASQPHPRHFSCHCHWTTESFGASSAELSLAVPLVQGSPGCVGDQDRMKAASCFQHHLQHPHLA